MVCFFLPFFLLLSISFLLSFSFLLSLSLSPPSFSFFHFATDLSRPILRSVANYLLQGNAEVLGNVSNVLSNPSMMENFARYQRTLQQAGAEQVTSRPASVDTFSTTGRSSSVVPSLPPSPTPSTSPMPQQLQQQQQISNVTSLAPTTLPISPVPSPPLPVSTSSTTTVPTLPKSTNAHKIATIPSGSKNNKTLVKHLHHQQQQQSHTPSSTISTQPLVSSVVAPSVTSFAPLPTVPTTVPSKLSPNSSSETPYYSPMTTPLSTPSISPTIFQQPGTLYAPISPTTPNVTTITKQKYPAATIAATALPKASGERQLQQDSALLIAPPSSVPSSIVEKQTVPPQHQTTNIATIPPLHSPTPLPTPLIQQQPMSKETLPSSSSLSMKDEDEQQQQPKHTSPMLSISPVPLLNPTTSLSLNEEQLPAEVSAIVRVTDLIALKVKIICRNLPNVLPRSIVLWPEFSNRCYKKSPMHQFKRTQSHLPLRQTAFLPLLHLLLLQVRIMSFFHSFTSHSFHSSSINRPKSTTSPYPSSTPHNKFSIDQTSANSKIPVPRERERERERGREKNR
jgi:hypothetical protein